MSRAVRTRRSSSFGSTRDEPGGLERAEQAAEVARVEVEPGPQPADVAAVGADLPEQTGLPERPVPGEVAVVRGRRRAG